MLKEFRSIDVYWDKATRQIYEEIRTSSSDEKGRKLTVQIVNDGQIQDLTNISLNLYWETQDGKNRGLDPFEPLDAENGIYELYFRTGMLKHVGKLNAHLHLVDTTGAITSEQFTISVFQGVDVDAMASDDELSALNQALIEVQNIKQLDGRITAVEQNIDERLAEKASKSDLEVERSRINAFTTLSEGSTTGDAELIDARVGADGITYPNAGDSIRVQIGKLKEDLGYSKETTFVPVFSQYVGKYIHDNGYLASNASFSTSDVIEIPSDAVSIKAINVVANRYTGILAFYKTTSVMTEHYISRVVPTGDALNVEIPSDANYILVGDNSDPIGIIGADIKWSFVSVSAFDKLTDMNTDTNRRVEKLIKKSEINIGTSLYAVVGDTLQVFKDSIIDSFGENYICKFECSKGRQYPRYWEYTPVLSDVGNTTLKIKLYSSDNQEVDSKTVNLITVNPSNDTINVLNVGDSTMINGEIPIELSRRIKGTNGIATTPEPLSLSNINIVGRIKNSGNNVGWEGTGGWTFSTYNGAGRRAVRFTVSNANEITVGDLIRITSTNSYGYYQFQVAEVNVTNGGGNIRAIFHTTAYADNFLNVVATSGVIKNQDGIKVGDYSTLAVEYYQPFWNNTTSSFDINTYVTNYCNSKCDYIFILLGINSLYGKNPWDDLSSIFNDCKALLRNIHSQLPNTTILLSTNHLLSQNGGLGKNYNCQTSFGQYDVGAINHLIFEMNKLYYTLESDTEFNSYVKVVNTHAQFDAKYSFPNGVKIVNTRNTLTELTDYNGAHPSNNGYWQISDAELRALIGINS